MLLNLKELEESSFTVLTKVQCDICSKIYSYKSYKSYLRYYAKYDNRDLCRGCKQRHLIKIGEIVPNTTNWINRNRSNKGKTYEEIYGKEKGKTFNKSSIRMTERNRSNKGKTYEEIYSQKTSEKMKKEISLRTRGEKNPMFGKPSNYVTNCLQGYYKGFYFRSSYELSFIKQSIEAGIEIASAETIEFTIKYEIDGISKTYKPDFYLPIEGLIIEIKPKILISHKNNIPKFNAARKIFGDKFRIFTENELNLLQENDIIELIKSGDLLLHYKGNKKYAAIASKWASVSQDR